MSRKIIAKFVIEAFADNTVQVSGPINNLLLFRRIMNVAEKAVLNGITEAMQKAQENKVDQKEVGRIIMPETILPVVRGNNEPGQV